MQHENKDEKLLTAMNDLRSALSHEMDEAEESEKFIETFRDFRRHMTMYSCAIREVRTKFEVLNEELSVSSQRNPIQGIYSRVKSPESIFGKMKRIGCPFSIKSMVDNLNDIAGIRIICQYIDDIYTVAAMLGGQDDISVINVKDYIKSPKPNGYRSFHMIVEVPVFFSNEKTNVRVEVQLRTIAMDSWATLEHGMKYKKEIADSAAIVAELKECADQVYALDTRMQALKDKIHHA